MVGKATRRNLDGEDDPMGHQKDASESQWRTALLQFWRGQLERIQAKLEKKLPANRKAVELHLSEWQALRFTTIDGRPGGAEHLKAADKLLGLDKSFWDNENRLLLAEILPLLSESAENAALFSAEGLEETTGIGIDWTLVNTAAAEWARTRSGELIKGWKRPDGKKAPGLNESTKRAVRASLAQFIETPGRTIGDLQQDLAKLPAFNDNRARMIAVTETTRSYFEGSMATVRTYENEGLFTWEKRWNTVNDGLVCFPAWTMVETDCGPTPIQKLRPGMMALTRRGYRTIRAINKRKYSGDMVRIEADQHGVVSTGGHPYWVSKQGWLEGRNIAPGQFLESSDKKPVRVSGAFKFSVGDAANIPAARLQIMGFAGISGGVSVPIDAINFKGDPKIAQKKINAVSPYASFLDIFNAKLIEHQSDLFFWQRFALTRTITSKGAKLPICIAGQLPEFNAAILTIDEDRGAMTFLRAETGDPSAFTRLKFLAASLANICPAPESGTFSTAISKAVRRSWRSFKGLTAARAHFNDSSDFQKGAPTFSAAKTATLFNLARTFISQFATNRTSDFLSCSGSKMITFCRAKNPLSLYLLRARKAFIALLTNISKRHGIHPLTRLNILYHKWAGTSMPVYNIQVDDVPEFYTNGLLVHNCDICRPLHRKRVAGLDTPFDTLVGKVQGPPLHVRCRCGVSFIPVIG